MIGHQQLTYAELQQRLSSHLYNTYSNLSWLIKSGVFALAGLAIVHIINSSMGALTKWANVSLWLASFGFVSVTFVKWTRGSILSVSEMTSADFIFPMLIGVCEYAFFLVLAGQESVAIYGWYLVLCGHSLFAAGLVANRRLHMNIEAEYDDLLRTKDSAGNEGLAYQQKAWMRNDMIGASGLSAVAFAIFVAMYLYGPHSNSPEAAILHISIGSVFTIVSVLIAASGLAEFRTIAHFVPGQHISITPH